MILLLEGDVLEMLQGVAGESVQCVVTSPPYWGLRDYKVAGQIGSEKTPEEYVGKLVAVFREVRRVLREDGTCWVNMGDSYNAAGRDGYGTRIGYKQGTNRASKNGDDRNRPTSTSLKPKDLVGVPWRLAFALQADGWYLRSDIIWAKPNPMPESVTDRPTKSHEYIYLLTKSARYYFDQEAVRERFETDPKENYPARAHVTGRGMQDYPGNHQDKSGGYPPNGNGRNIRSVWTIATEPFKGNHFATFPRKLVTPCILAGTSEKGCCGKCGAPWERVVQIDRVKDITRHTGRAATGNFDRMDGDWPCMLKESNTTGWRPTCKCNDSTVPCTVLDPFAGSGTVGVVAETLGRDSILIELSGAYCKIARDRIAKQAPGAVVVP